MAFLLGNTSSQSTDDEFCNRVNLLYILFKFFRSQNYRI